MAIAMNSFWVRLAWFLIAMTPGRLHQGRVTITPVRTEAQATFASTAAVVAQGVDSGEFLEALTLAAVDEVLALVRLQYPQLARLVPEGSYWAVEAVITSGLSDTLRRGGNPIRRGHFLPHWYLPRANVPRIAQLVTSMAAESLTVRLGMGPGDRALPVLRVVFRYAMNLPVVLDAFRRTEGIVHAFVSEDEGPQTGHFASIQRDGNTWRLRFDEGLAGCPISCRAWRRWLLTYRQGRLSLVSNDLVFARS